MERKDWRLRCDGDGGVGFVPVLDNYIELVSRVVLRNLRQARWQIFSSAGFREGGIVLGLVTSWRLIVIAFRWFVPSIRFSWLLIQRGNWWRMFFMRKGWIVPSFVTCWRFVVIALWRFVPNTRFGVC